MIPKLCDMSLCFAWFGYCACMKSCCVNYTAPCIPLRLHDMLISRCKFCRLRGDSPKTTSWSFFSTTAAPTGRPTIPLNTLSINETMTTTGILGNIFG